MKICAISDLHGYLPEIPKCDLLLIAGDVCPETSPEKQIKWLEKIFSSWLGAIKVPIFGIAGNHDFPMQESPEAVEAIKLPWTYLKDEMVEYKGLKIYGSPWTVHYPDIDSWAFMKHEYELNLMWNKIPNDTDILIAHSPPMYYGDLTLNGTHAGSESLLERISELKLKLVVFGHIHEARGDWKFKDTQLANVSLMGKYAFRKHVAGVNVPWVWEM